MPTKGSKDDFVERLRTLLPPSWFPHDSEQRTVIDALLEVYATQYSYVYDLLQEVITQSRVLTATDGTLDLISYDFFGDQLPRRGRTDVSFRRAIDNELLASRNTVSAIRTAVQKQAGIVPWVLEPTNHADCGAYASSLIPANQNPAYQIQYGNAEPNGRSNVGSGRSGYYGSLNMTSQFMVMVRPATSTGVYGSPNAAGYGSSNACGYYSIDTSTQPVGTTAISIAKYQFYSSLAYDSGYASNEDVFKAINRTKAAGTTAWVKFI